MFDICDDVIANGFTDVSSVHCVTIAFCISSGVSANGFVDASPVHCVSIACRISADDNGVNILQASY